MHVASLRHPFRVRRSFLDPAWSLCSHSQIPCQVPRLSLPSVIGMLREEPRKHAFTWAGCNRRIYIVKFILTYTYSTMNKVDAKALFFIWNISTKTNLPYHLDLHKNVCKANPQELFYSTSSPYHPSHRGPNSHLELNWHLYGELETNNNSKVCTGIIPNWNEFATISKNGFKPNNFENAFRKTFMDSIHQKNC